MNGFTKLFLENFIAELGLESLGSTLPTTSVIGGTSTSCAGSEIMDSTENDLVQTLGLGVISTGTAVSWNGPDAYEKTMRQLQLTQAYIESLDEQQINEFITKLEIKDEKLTLKRDKTNFNNHNKF